METQPITLEHKKAVESLRKKYGNFLSSHAFASIYLWRQEMGLRLLLEPSFYTVRCSWMGQNAWFFPCGEVDSYRAFLDEKRKEKDFSLCYMRQEDVRWLEAQFPGQWRFSRRQEADEYLYDANGHRALKGGAYANMRTQVHKVEREYSPRIVPLGPENLQEALEIIRQWSHGHHRFDACDLRDDQVDEEAMLLQRELDIQGILLYLDEKPTAVTAGFYLDDQVFDIAVAKSISAAQGVSYYAKWALLSSISCSVINLEEDLGIPGLREMKSRLHPVGKNEIWEARPI